MRHFIKPCDPRCALLVEPSERVREVLREEGYTPVDAEAFKVHRRAWPVEEER